MARVELFRRHLDEGRKDGRHRVVDRDVDWAELFFDALRRGLHLLVVRDVRLYRQRTAAEALDLVLCPLEAVFAAGKYADVRALFGETDSTIARSDPPVPPVTTTTSGRFELAIVDPSS